jgi:hypothetical protein
MTVSAAVMFLLGALHLFYTFIGNKLHPRNAELQTRLEQVSASGRAGHGRGLIPR